MKKSLMSIICLCFVMIFPSRAYSIMVGLSTEELTKSSEFIVVGKVESVESIWSKDGKTIISRALIVINEVIKGEQSKERVTVEYPGGEIGDIGLKVSDVRTLKKGEETLLFLKSKKDQKREDEISLSIGEEDIYQITGNAQGHYTIDHQGIARKGGFSLIQREDATDNNIPLNILIDKIRGVKN
ncbi:MAG: hypothetical protein OEZ31_00485 [Nitrospirota bacterium]|nr:hypothetical protein [Nitrospirota bacterium]MDH5767423.1 hypothetical protein [Nitrospirota bacterium]